MTEVRPWELEHRMMPVGRSVEKDATVLLVTHEFSIKAGNSL